MDPVTKYRQPRDVDNSEHPKRLLTVAVWILMVSIPALFGWIGLNRTYLDFGGDGSEVDTGMAQMAWAALAIFAISLAAILEKPGQRFLASPMFLPTLVYLFAMGAIVRCEFLLGLNA